jgi:hypothetical protein
VSGHQPAQKTRGQCLFSASLLLIPWGLLVLKGAVLSHQHQQPRVPLLVSPTHQSCLRPAEGPLGLTGGSKVAAAWAVRPRQSRGRRVQARVPPHSAVQPRRCRPRKATGCGDGPVRTRGLPAPESAQLRGLQPVSCSLARAPAPELAEALTAAGSRLRRTAINGSRAQIARPHAAPRRGSRVRPPADGLPESTAIPRLARPGPAAAPSRAVTAGCPKG